MPMLSSAQYLNTTVVKPMVVTVSANGNGLHSNNSITIPATVSTVNGGGIVVQATGGKRNINGSF